jgi:hypothetical protein
MKDFKFLDFENLNIEEEEEDDLRFKATEEESKEITNVV